LREPATTRSAVAVASPARTSSTICGIEKPWASVIASVQPSRQEASSSSARRLLVQPTLYYAQASAVLDRSITLPQ
jgi:hypothetical protein